MLRFIQADISTQAAALRETEEEVGIRPDQIEILGRFGPAQTSLGGYRVWPYVVSKHMNLDGTTQLTVRIHLHRLGVCTSHTFPAGFSSRIVGTSRHRHLRYTIAVPKLAQPGPLATRSRSRISLSSFRRHFSAATASLLVPWRTPILCCGRVRHYH